MAYDLNSPCIYNLPVSSESLRAGRSNSGVNYNDCIVGPMPPLDFLEYFFPQPQSSDRSRHLTDDDAFGMVPFKAQTALQIYTSMVKNPRNWFYRSVH